MLSSEEVLRIAELAKIKISEGDVERYQKDLSAILDFIGTLSKLPAREKSEHSQMMALESIFRKDEERAQEIEKGPKLVDTAPEHKNGFVLSPHILNKDK